MRLHIRLRRSFTKLCEFPSPRSKCLRGMPEGFTRTGLPTLFSVTKWTSIGRRAPVGIRRARRGVSHCLEAGTPELIVSRARFVCAGRRAHGDRVVVQAFWYENSQGLVEIAVNRGSAAEKLNLEPGTRVGWAS